MADKRPHEMNRKELARHLAACPRHSAAWREAHEVWEVRFERISKMGSYARISILACALLIALVTLLR